MADLVSEIISEEAQKQLDFTSDQLDLLTKQVAELAKAGKAIQFDFKGAKDFAFADEVIKKATASIAHFDSAQKALNKQVLDNAKALQLEAKANLDNAKAATEAAKQTEIQTRYTAALEKEKAKLQAAHDKEAASLKKLGNDYEILKKAYIEAANRAKNLGVTVGTNSVAFKEAAAEAMRMHEVLLKVETAVGQSQRNVGNYTSALMSMSQVIREAPAFANSLQTGLSAIGNNMPILIDEFNRLKEEVGSAAKAMKIMASSIFSFTNMFTLAFTALQFLQIYLSHAGKEVDEFAESLNKMDKQAKASGAETMAHVNMLTTLAKDQTVAMEIRLRAVKDLQEQYPDYLGNLKTEAILSGNITKEVNKLNEALFNKALMGAAEKKIGAVSEKWQDVREKLDEAYDAQKKYQAEVDKFAASAAKQNGVLKSGGFGSAEYGLKLKGAKDDIKKLTAEMYLLELQSQRFERYKNEYAKKAGFLAVGQPDKPHKDPKEKSDNEGKGAQKLAEEKYKNAIQEVETSRDKNKAIADDEKKSLAERLDAYLKYQADMMQLAEMEAGKEIKVSELERDRLIKLAGEAKGEKLKNLQNLIDAETYAIDTATKKRNKIVADIVATGRKEITGIYTTSGEEWVAEQDKAFHALEYQQVVAYEAEMVLFKKALDNKLITQKEYDKKTLALKKQQQLVILDAEIQHDTDLLEHEHLADETRDKIEKDRADKRKQKADLLAGGGQKTGRTKGRITDPLANLITPAKEGEDLQEREKYLQEFYNRAAQLANEAADAIIAAQERQFDSQMKMLDTEKEAIGRNAQLKEDAILAGAGTDIEKTNEIAKLHAQTAIQEEQIEQKKKAIARERAQFEKAAAMAAIIQNTAVAIAAALKYTVGAPALIAIISALGAAQLAAVATAPIPAYKEGTEGHIGGLFIAGDGNEPEYIKAPNKRGYWSASTSTLYNEAAGTTVTPLSKLMGMDATHMGGFSTPDSSAAITKMGNKITDKLDETMEVIAISGKLNRSIFNQDSTLATELRKQRKLQ